MKLSVKKSLMVAAAALVFTVTACGNQENKSSGGSGDGKELNFAFITHANPSDPFWQVIKSGEEAAAKQAGVKVNYQSDPDPVKQSGLIDNAVASKVDGIIVTMANPEGLKDSVKKAISAGIPVIGVNSGFDGWKDLGVFAFVGQDEYIAGQKSGERAKGQGSKAICVMHEQGNIALERRCKGFGETFGGPSEPLYVDIADIAGVLSSIQAKLQADPSIDMVVTVNTAVGVAASQAIEQANSKAKLVNFDVSSDILDLIKKDKLLFAIDQQPYAQGYLGVQLLTMYKRQGIVVGGGEAVLTGPGFITKDNVKDVERYASEGTR